MVGNRRPDMLTEYEAFDLYNIYFPNGGLGEERLHFKAFVL